MQATYVILKILVAQQKNKMKQVKLILIAYFV